ncbi:hypothetical protein [Vibrio sp. NH-UV-68]|uniref:hypothetical protein n=1 Tax=unclassified Vibrio TaxID=2614977 RepID=UPI0036F40190
MSTSIKLILIVLALSGGFFASDIIKWFQSPQTNISLNDYCLVTTAGCQQDGIRITADRDTTQPLAPTQLTVDWPNSSSETLFLTLQGYEMDMGKLVFKLDKNPQGQFTGQVVLPVCTSDAMTWYGTLSDQVHSINTSIRMER